MEEGTQFLVADVGATKVLMMLAEYHQEETKIIDEKTFLCRDYDDLQEVINVFLSSRAADFAVIGVPGVVIEKYCDLTNLSWRVSTGAIEQGCNIEKVILLNDIELISYGLDYLSDDDLVEIQKGNKKHDTIKGVISVGTGLGQGMAIGGKAYPSEGGHCDFAASSEEEIDFLKFIQKKFDHISYERVLSGEGIVNVYEFFSGKRNLTAREVFLEEGDYAKKAVQFFLQILGAEAGNFSLKTLCYGGLYFFGGVLEKKNLLLKREVFLTSFFSKGRFGEHLKEIPIYLIKTNKVYLYGALQLFIQKD